MVELPELDQDNLNIYIYITVAAAYHDYII